MGRFDLHIHSIYSHDSSATIEGILLEAQRKGLNGIAITEHSPYNSSRIVEGTTNNLKKSGNLNKEFIVLYGLEFKTDLGHHVLGLFPEPFNLISRETPCFEDLSEEIHSNDGAVVAAHPFDLFGRGMGGYLSKYDGGVDAIEAINGTNIYSTAVYLTNTYRMICGEPNGCVGGSDAHNVSGVGSGYTIAKAESAEELLLAIETGDTCPGISVPHSMLEMAKQSSNTGTVYRVTSRALRNNFKKIFN